MDWCGWCALLLIFIFRKETHINSFVNMHLITVLGKIHWVYLIKASSFLSI